MDRNSNLQTVNEEEMKQQINLQKQRLNLTKFIALILTLALDLSLNSVLDYDLFNDQYRGTASSTSTGTQLLLGLAGLQIVVNISIFLILFLAMADTFLFRVGLLGLLLKKFRSVLLIHPVYITLTIATGAYRVNHFSSGNTLATLWKDQSFFALSSIHKIGESHSLTKFPKSFRTFLLKNRIHCSGHRVLPHEPESHR